MKFRPLLAFIALLALAPAAQAQRQWLDSGPVPTRYEIAITPNVEAATFAGAVTIAVESAESVSAVTLNALDLEVSRATIDNRVVAVTTSAEAQTLTLTPRRPLRAGRHTIRIAYAGKIQDEA